MFKNAFLKLFFKLLLADLINSFSKSKGFASGVMAVLECPFLVFQSKSDPPCIRHVEKNLSQFALLVPAFL